MEVAPRIVMERTVRRVSFMIVVIGGGSLRRMGYLETDDFRPARPRKYDKIERAALANSSARN